MSWSDDYIGIPEKAHGRDRRGLDCWGLVWLVHANELGIDLPCHSDDYRSTNALGELDALLSSDVRRHDWIEVPGPGWFTVPLFRTGRYASHVGVTVDAQHFLHVTGGSVRLTLYSDPVWRCRLLGHYRHVEAP
ncbi:NlpC/P60 family protein [uncultured Tateyamaria sp.]|uniref:NlpC/P60 family protein n=1 Tax=uncultured Tateyamaria sp. TaxID=455651 RepID=UPI0026277634|nr:NlpC/P60 family protein [uncultured Tateyamaria sp.]